MDQGVGHEIKRLRERRGWSQAKLAVEADMSVSGVSMIENGQRNLTTTTLAKLAGAFGLEIADLFPKASAPLQLEFKGQAGRHEELPTLEEMLGVTEPGAQYEILLREAFQRVESGEDQEAVIREVARLFWDMCTTVMHIAGELEQLQESEGDTATVEEVTDTHYSPAK